ncbi:MAG: hypothetical protein KAI47_09295, partial [Deltaproteobacteria bacterium]|nr:hypothetical protein [Deltaproteobacteria bacterium]
LPRPKRPGLGEVFGNKQSLVPSSAEHQALLRYALAGEITRTLQSIDGVRKARVHVVIPRRDPLAAPDKKRPRPRAAILLEVAGKLSISSDEVRRLVAGSVEDLDKSAVEVVITPVKGSRAKPLAAPGALASVGPFRVAPGSRGGLLATLTSAVLLILILALTLVVFALRFRALRRLRAEETTSRRATSADIESSLSLLGQSFGRSQSRRPPS